MYIIYNHKEENFPYSPKVFNTLHDALCRIAETIDDRIFFGADEMGIGSKKLNPKFLKLEMVKRIWPSFANMLIYDIDYDRILYPTAFYWQIQKILGSGNYSCIESGEGTDERSFQNGPVRDNYKIAGYRWCQMNMGRKSVAVLADPELKDYLSSRDRKRVLEYTSHDYYEPYSSTSWKDKTKNRKQWAVHKSRCKTSKTGMDYNDFINYELPEDDMDEADGVVHDYPSVNM